LELGAESLELFFGRTPHPLARKGTYRELLLTRTPTALAETVRIAAKSSVINGIRVKNGALAASHSPRFATQDWQLATSPGVPWTGHCQLFFKNWQLITGKFF